MWLGVFQVSSLNLEMLGEILRESEIVLVNTYWSFKKRKETSVLF